MTPALMKALQSGQGYDAAIDEAAAPMRMAIQQALEQKPFQLFRIKMSDRSVHEIRDPQWVELRSSVVQITFPDPNAPSGPPLWRILSLIHVVSIEVVFADEPAVVPGAPSEMK